jgi:type 1 glutamine amidotransferase
MSHKILLISNPMPSYHRIENTLPQLEKALDDFQLDHTQDLDDLSAGKLGGYDAVLNYCTGTELSDEQWATLDQFVAGGGGLIGIHNATDTWKNQAGYISLIGGKFITHPAQLSIEVEVVNPDHPIMQGMEPFETWEELYIMETDTTSYDLLLQTRSYEDTPRPIAWAKEYGSGRVFYTALGHEPVERADGGPFSPHFHTLLKRGTLWAMRQL